MRKYNPKDSKVVIENGRVYTVSEKVEAPLSDLEIFEKMSDKDKKKRLDMIRKAVEKIDKKNMAKAKKDALAMMKSSGMFDEELEERQIIGMQSAHVVEPITDSTAEYARSLRKIALDKQLKKISKKDKDLLTKIADMLAKEKK
jgi:hypothetical protein